MSQACSRCGGVGAFAVDKVEEEDDGFYAPCLHCGEWIRLTYDAETGVYSVHPDGGGPTVLPKLARFGAPILAVPAGYLVIAAWHTFVWPNQGELHSVPLGVLTGLVAVALAVIGRGYAGAALGLVVGVLLIAKPFAFPVGASLTSERAMNYHTTGLALVVGAGVILGSIKGTLAARRVRPNVRAVAGLGAGLLIGLMVHARPIKAEVWARHKETIHTWTERFRTVALAIDDAHVHAPTLPSSVADLDPKPSYANAEVVPVDKLRDPLKVGSPDHVKNGPVRRCLQQMDLDYRGAQFTDEFHDAPFKLLKDLRYVVAYEFPKKGRIVIWIADAEGKLLARLTAPHDPSKEPWKVCDDLVEQHAFGLKK